MSSYEYHTGTLTEIKPNDSITLEELASSIVIELDGEDFEHSYESNLAYLLDNYDDYALLNGKLYEIDDTEISEDSSATINADGTITYNVSFYNGGCGLHEAIEDTLKTLEL